MTSLKICWRTCTRCDKLDEDGDTHDRSYQHAAGDNDNAGDASAAQQKRELLRLPGLAAIGLYLAALAGVIIIGVVRGMYPAFLLIFSVLFFAAAGGLMLLFRWAWALALAAVLLLAIYNMWIFSSEHLAPALFRRCSTGCSSST